MLLTLAKRPLNAWPGLDCRQYSACKGADHFAGSVPCIAWPASPAGAKVSVVETRAYREEQANAMANQQANAALQQQEGSEQAGMRGKLAPIRLQVDGLQAQVRDQQGTAQTGGFGGFVSLADRQAAGRHGRCRETGGRVTRATQTDRRQGDTRWRAYPLAGGWPAGTVEALKMVLGGSGGRAWP